MLDDSHRRPSTIRALAQAGNAVALFAVLLILINSGSLFTTKAPTPPSLATEVTRNTRLLLVVVDGLRADAVTSGRMPQVQAIAQRGMIRTSRVEALLPSTVAGLRALVEGVIVPPSEFVNDFRSRRAPSGGLIEAVHRSGGRVFVAGPHLWADLYGRWITATLAVAGLARDDRSVLRAAHAAILDPQYKLLAVHFCSPDVMAHMHGAASPEYAGSVAWCDRAIGDLARAAGQNTLVVITSDHGVTVAGGHAGAEPDVLETPVVASDHTFAAALKEPLVQRHLPHLLAAAMGTSIPSAATPASASFLSSGRVLPAVAAAVLGGLAVMVLLSTSSCTRPPEYAAFNLNVSVWVSIAAAWLNLWAGCALSFISLLFFGWHYRSRVPRSLVSAFAAGIAIGALRVVIPWATLGTKVSFQASLLMIAIVCIAAFALGVSAARQSRSGAAIRRIWLGAGIIITAPLLSSFLGESVSLSTLDVRLAFRFFETPAGLTSAVLIAASRPFLPALFLVAGVTYCWWRRRESGTSIASLSAGAGAVIAGELAFAAVLLAGSANQFLSALALGLLIRESALVAVIFPVLAGAVLVVRKRENIHFNPAPLQTAPPS